MGPLLVSIPIFGGLALSVGLLPSLAFWFWKITSPSAVDTSVLAGVQLFMLYLVFSVVLLSPVLGGVGLGVLLGRRRW